MVTVGVSSVHLTGRFCRVAIHRGSSRSSRAIPEATGAGLGKLRRRADHNSRGGGCSSPGILAHLWVPLSRYSREFIRRAERTICQNFMTSTCRCSKTWHDTASLWSHSRLLPPKPSALSLRESRLRELSDAFECKTGVTVMLNVIVKAR